MILDYGPKGTFTKIDFDLVSKNPLEDIKIKYNNLEDFVSLSSEGVENVYEFYQESLSWILIIYKNCELYINKKIKNVDIGGIGGGGAGGETTENGSDPNNYQIKWEIGGGGGAGGQRQALLTQSLDKKSTYIINIGQGVSQNNGTSTYIKKSDEQLPILEALGGLKAEAYTPGNNNNSMLNSAKGGAGNSWSNSSPVKGGDGTDGDPLFSNSYFSSNNQKDLLVVGGGGAGAGGWYVYTQGGYGSYGDGTYGRGGRGANKDNNSNAGNSGLLMIRGQI